MKDEIPDGDIRNLRKQLDRIDRSIIEALAGRERVVDRLLSVKVGGARSVRDIKREEKVLGQIRHYARAAGLDPYYAEQLYREIISHSVRAQTHAMIDYHNPNGSDRSIRIAYQGVGGSYSHLAAHRHFDQRYAVVESVGYDTFQGAADAVRKGVVDAAVLPVENTTAGSINETYDLLGDGGLVIVGEEVLRVRHCLLAVEEIPVERVRRILSHPQALAQCTRFLVRLENCHVESYIDTAMAARKVADDGDLSQAAIAGAQAAERYGLRIIATDIANQDENYTRFVIVAKEPIYCDIGIPCKTSLVIATPHQKGALLECLRVFGDYGLNMSKLESRPKPHTPWQYLFYLDLEGNTADARVRQALVELEKRSAMVKLLGCYPAQVHSEDVAEQDYKDHTEAPGPGSSSQS